MAGGGGQGSQAFASTLTDLMTSLAVIFILLLVVFLKQAHDQSRKAKNDVHQKLDELLKKKDLALTQDPDDPLTLAVALGESQLRFPVGGYSLAKPGSQFIAGFFKNFATQICGSELRDKIDSLMIEGHTDESGEKTPAGVRHNIELSQKRSFSVLEEALKSVQGDQNTYDCLLKLASASGRGSRNPIVVNGTYHPELSRRVEIKIRVRSAEQQFRKLIEEQQAHAASRPALAPAPHSARAPTAPFAAPALAPPPGAGTPPPNAPTQPGALAPRPAPPPRVVAPPPLSSK